MIKQIILAGTLVIGAWASAALQPGDVAPDFSLKGADGKTYKLSEFKERPGHPGQPVVLEWFNQDCPFVHKYYDSKTMQGLQSESRKNYGVAWLTIVSSAPGKQGHLKSEDAMKVKQDKGMNNTALLMDEDSTVARMYGAKTTPHMFVIDKNGLLAYQGAIDDKPSANPKSLEGAQNYVRKALMALPLTSASTTPYGCSVKY